MHFSASLSTASAIVTSCNLHARNDAHALNSEVVTLNSEVVITLNSEVVITLNSEVVITLNSEVITLNSEVGMALLGFLTYPDVFESGYFLLRN